jgi:hypothetical protein
VTAEDKVAGALARRADKVPVPADLWPAVSSAVDQRVARRGRLLAGAAALVAVLVVALALWRIDRSGDDRASPSPGDGGRPSQGRADLGQLPATFVALLESGQLAVVSTVSQRIEDVVVVDCKGCKELSYDGRTVTYTRDGAVFAVQPGEEPSEVGPGCSGAAEGDAVVVLSCEGGEVTVHEDGRRQTWSTGLDGLTGAGWAPAGSSLLFSAGDRSPALYRLDRSPDATPERLGPPAQGQAPGTGWISPRSRPDGVMVAAEVCCRLGEASYPSQSTVIYLAASDGHQLVRSPIRTTLTGLDVDGTGRFLLLTAADGDVYAEWDGQRARIGAGYRAAAW